MKKILTSILGTMLLVGSGLCESATTSDEDIIGTAIKATAVAGKGDAHSLSRQAGIFEGDMIQEQGRKEHEREAAERGRSEVNTYNDQKKFYDGKLKNGAYYKGQIKNNQPHGFGTYTLPDGKKYVGEFQDGKMKGQGTLTWPGGSKYVGEWKDGKSNGQGTFTSPDGSKYVGEWKDGKRNGFGKTTFANGKIQEGFYDNDKFINARKNVEDSKP